MRQEAKKAEQQGWYLGKHYNRIVGKPKSEVKQEQVESPSSQTSPPPTSDFSTSEKEKEEKVGETMKEEKTDNEDQQKKENKEETLKDQDSGSVPTSDSTIPASESSFVVVPSSPTQVTPQVPPPQNTGWYFGKFYNQIIGGRKSQVSASAPTSPQRETQNIRPHPQKRPIRKSKPRSDSSADIDIGEKERDRLREIEKNKK